MENRHLPSARYIKLTCPHCSHRFSSDQGKQYDRFEYIIEPRRTEATCPLCLKEGTVDKDDIIFGLVVN